jgi:N-acetylneuraminate synthase
MVVDGSAPSVGGHMESLSIRERRIAPDEPPYIIAEIGANHNGDMNLCCRLIDAAQSCGVDAVKFQSWTKESLISSAEYARNTKYTAGDKKVPTLEEAVEQYQLSAKQHREIAAYCKARNVVFFSSCFSPAEVDLLETLDVPAYKIASMDVNHLPLLQYVAKTHKPVILSTGMATLGEIETALETLRGGGAGPVVLLHCVSIYPSPPEIMNLRNIQTLKRAFDVPVGFSDHTLGVSVPLASVALGACMIEKHFTLDKTLEGWDHAVSADPAEMNTLVRESRFVFSALGSSVRRVNDAEMQKRATFRRRIVAKRELKNGQILTAEDFEFKRPGTGIRPDELAYVVGRRLTRGLCPDDELEWTDLT